MANLFSFNDRRFFELSEVPQLFAAPNKMLRLLILADDQHPANAVQEHIRCFFQHSSHRVQVVNTRNIKRPDQYTASSFDAVLIHYSIFVIAETYLSTEWEAFISTFHGPVAVIHEDEYQSINAFTRKFKDLGVQAVFSCLDSTANLERVYGQTALPGDTLLFSCLPGYISSDLPCASSPPIAERYFHIIYRGRTLRPELGRFAQEKRVIGEQMLSVSAEHGLKSNIAFDEESRIYGEHWPAFLRSGKAMLGVEGGASIFDFDGSISDAVAAYTEVNPNAEFEEIWSSVLAKHEGNIQFRTITPKFFEAIAAKTALVLYAGKYRNVLIPNRHYIQLERDGSNMSEVVAKLKDDAYLQEMADRTHEEILPKPELGNQFYVNQIDRVLCALAKNTSSSRLVRMSIAAASIQQRQQQKITSMQAELAATQAELAATQAELASYLSYKARKLLLNARANVGSKIARFFQT